MGLSPSGSPASCSKEWCRLEGLEPTPHHYEGRGREQKNANDQSCLGRDTYRFDAYPATSQPGPSLSHRRFPTKGILVGSVARNRPRAVQNWASVRCRLGPLLGSSPFGCNQYPASIARRIASAPVRTPRAERTAARCIFTVRSLRPSS